MFCCLKVELCKLFVFQLERKQVVLGCLEKQTTQDGVMINIVNKLPCCLYAHSFVYSKDLV